MALNNLRPKKDVRTKAKKQAEFLAKLAECASLTRACRLAKVPRASIYQWLNADAGFKQKYADACVAGLQSLEDEAVRRAVEGLPRPVFYQGKKIGTIKEFSDTLLMALLKAKAPARYKDRMKGGGDEKDDIAVPPKPRNIIKWGDWEIPV